MVKGIRRTKATRAERNRIPQETKLLVVHLKPFLYHVLKTMEPNPKKIRRVNLEKTLNNNTSLEVFRECFKVKKFRDLTIQMIESQQLLQFLYTRRTQYRNFAKLIKYMNQFINIAYNPSLIVVGYWTHQFVVQKQNDFAIKQEEQQEEEDPEQ